MPITTLTTLPNWEAYMTPGWQDRANMQSGASGQVEHGLGDWENFEGYKGTTGIGTLSYANKSQYGGERFQQATDPDRTLANIARGQHERYIRNFRDYEDALVASRDDTSLIDAAREDAPEQARISRGIAERQRGRYGLQQTAVETRETERASQRGEAINLAGGLNNARLAQRDSNRRLLGDLINIGQGVNRSSLSQLGMAAQTAVERKNAFRQAKAQSKAQNTSLLATAASAIAMIAWSDYRLKENVVTDWDATTRLKQLKPSRFNFIADADSTMDGFLAHEVSSIVPEAITGTKDGVDSDGNPEYQQIDQSKLVPLLVKTIQELEARIAALEA